MTRPQIIRADTLDLQDKTSPTAQDHSRQPQHPAPLGIGPAAPHQQASLRHVTEEQSSEESQLRQSVWANTTTLRDDPGSDDERTILNGESDLPQDEQAVRLNGGIPGSADDGEMADADDDLDDDMMDKISSSPSIDDGGYLLPQAPFPWPRRSTSLTPTSTPTRVTDHDAMSSPDSSSPFTTTPLHFPIRPAAARRQDGTLAVESGPACTSPRSSPPHSPLLDFLPAWSTEHHREREYTSSVEPLGPAPRQQDDENDDLSDTSSNLSLMARRFEEMMEYKRLLRETPISFDIDQEDADAPVPMGWNFRLHEARLANYRRSKDHYPDRSLSPNSASSWITDSDLDSAIIDDKDDDDDSDDVSFSPDDRFIDSGWGGECLRELEDIDFEFVYALHTFVATVEGQANASKGDTMVLLDDSNSYWWLVRVVKDSSIGYLPAEHIETPTERLARLNKHRNIDLSAAMLGDPAEKTKNPLKKAMRRRNAKTVQFAAPTYVEASDYDYSSSDEDGDDELFGGTDPNQVQADVNNDGAEAEQDENLKVQPLKVNGAKKETKAEDEITQDANDASNNADKARTSDEIFDRPLDQKISRNGTLRNTDSFFKDDNAETRKITLTPNLLRDDSSTSTTGSRERGPSLESLEKNGFADKVKEDKKKKEKKPGMLSGLFKRKDKKSKGSNSVDSIDSDVEKVSEELGRSSPQQRVLEEKQAERPSTDTETAHSPQRQASRGKLQKPQRTRDTSPSKVKSPETGSPPLASPKEVGSKEPPSARPSGTQATSTMRLVSAEADEPVTAPVETRVQSPDGARARATSAASKLNPMNMIHRQPSEARPEQVKKAKQRVQLDDFDSPIEEQEDPFADPKAEQQQQEKAQQSNATEPTGRLSESPVQISAAEVQTPEPEAQREKSTVPDPQQAPGLTGDTSSQDTGSPVSTPSREESPSNSNTPNKPSLSATRPPRSPSPTSLSQAPSTIHTPSRSPPNRPVPTPTVPKIDTSPPVSSSSSLPAWSDSSLRSYLDDGSDIRDMLLLIHDTNGIVPVGPEHPIMAGLFVEERKTVTQLGGELDGLLGKWLERKRKRGVGSSSNVLR